MGFWDILDDYFLSEEEKHKRIIRGELNLWYRPKWWEILIAIISVVAIVYGMGLITGKI